jgi:arylsulfatase A-like enzyme
VRRILLAIILACLGIWFYLRYPFATKHPNVILIMIDTLRGNHLGVYGYPRATSPNLDTFAKENLMFRRAIAVAPWTPPSTASILTGLAVARHGFNPHLSANAALENGQRLSSKLNTLPEILNNFGYQSAGVSSNPWISESFNFTQGMRPFYYVNHAKTDIVLDQARKAIEGFQAVPNRPFFLYVHIIDPHGPYQPPVKYAMALSGPNTEANCTL